MIGIIGLMAALLGANGYPAATGLHGVVTVRGSGALSGVMVVLEGAGGRKETVTGPGGEFVFEGLAAASGYRLSVQAAGFRAWARQGLTIEPGQTWDLKVALELNPVTETVNVVGEIPAVPSDAPEISQTVDARRLAELPANGRSLNRFALLNPHVRNTAGLGSDSSAGARLSINASSFRHTNYALDGATNYDSVFANAPQQALSVSAVQEFKVLTNQYSAEYGGSTAGILSTVTRSGGDRFHGEAFAFMRPSGIQAAPPVSDRRVPNDRRQYGGALGGPLGGRTNFFTNFERVSQERGAFIQSPRPATFIGRLDEWYALAKLDHRWTGAHSLALRLNANRSANTNANDRVSGFTQASAAQSTTNQNTGAQVTLRSVFGGALNEGRAAYVNNLPSNATPASPQVSIVRPSYSTEGGSARSWVRTGTAQFSDVAAFAAGRHSLKAGGDYLRIHARDFSVTPFGEYRFAPGAPTPGQAPLQYTQTFGIGNIRYGQTAVSGFVQDDWKALARLTLNLGLRYEFQSITQDRNNWAPRLGLAWDVNGSGRTVVRAGAGVFYDQYYLYINRRFYLQGPDAPTASYTIFPNQPGFPVFPNSLTAPPAGVTEAKRNLYLPAERLLNPYSLQYSVGVQQELGAQWLLTLDLIHTHTLKQMRIWDRNAPAPMTRTTAGQMRTTAEADATRPVESYRGLPVRSLNVVENSGSSLYDAVDVGLLRRFAGRFQVEGHYVASAATNYSMFFGEPDTGIPNDWGNAGTAERGPSDFHQRHRLVGHGLVELPWRTQLSGIVTLASGLPVNPLTGVDNNGDGVTADRPAGFGRNSFRAPAQSGVDVSFQKRWVWRERVTLEFRADAYNLFNRLNAIKVNNTYGNGAAPSATFLRPVAGVQNSDPARQFQTSLRLVF